MTAFAEPLAATNFSFLRGASHPHEMVARAHALGMAGIGIADRNTVAGVVRAHMAWKELGGAASGFRLIVGARLGFADGTPDLAAYPLTRRGWGRLTRLLTLGNRRVEKGECELHLADLLDHAQDMALIATEGDAALLQTLREATPHLWLSATMPRAGQDARRLARRMKLSAETRVPLIASNDALYARPEDRPLHDVLTCIREGVSVQTAGRLLMPNAERHLKNPEEMARLLRACPEAVAATQDLFEAVTFTLHELEYQYPLEPVPSGWEPQGWLENLVAESAAKQFPEGLPADYRRVLDEEFELIRAKNYACYFLTVHDIVRHARSLDPPILCQGRGSAANSLVCYLLGVTPIDPVKEKLLFSRFLSEQRNEPPDIDVDFEHERREEVIQYIYRRYGRERAGIAATVIHYRQKSAIREVGKALGLTEDITARLSGTVWGSWGGGEMPDARMAEAGFDAANPEMARLREMTGRVLTFPRHLSQHVGGFVLTQDRLDELVPIHNGAMEDRTFIEWDKDDIDALNIMKVDVLALGMLTCIRKSFDLMRRHGLDRHALGLNQTRSSRAKSRDIGRAKSRDIGRAKPRPATPQVLGFARTGPSTSLGTNGAGNETDFSNQTLTLATVPREDKATYDMLCKGDSIGTFQVESRAQIAMLPRMRPRELYDLVIEVAIVRPGPIQGGMVHPYLRRRNGEEAVEYPGPPGEIRSVLEKTLGVPLFQEQAMKLAIVAAGFTPAEADGLRRAMATFRNHGTIGNYHDRLVQGMVLRGYPEDFAERCFEQIRGFGEYGFPESHAQAFAWLAYVSAWLKCHYPAVFTCALLNSQPMGFYAPAQLVRDAQEHGVEVRPIDVGASGWDNLLEGERVLRLGLRQVDGFREAWADALVRARSAAPFASIEDLARRAALPAQAMRMLADADALGSLGKGRRAAGWDVRRLPPEQLPLFAAQGAPELGAEPDPELPEMLPSEEVVADYQTHRMSLKGHPMQFLRRHFARQGVLDCASINAAKNGAKVRAAGVVLVRQRPGTGNAIFITIEDETGIVNAMLWSRDLERQRRAVMASRLMVIEGEIQRSKENVVHLMAKRIIDASEALSRLSEGEPIRPDKSRGDAVQNPVYPRLGHPRNVRVLPKSRDFH